jgi:hypothetical protein
MQELAPQEKTLGEAATSAKCKAGAVYEVGGKTQHSQNSKGIVVHMPVKYDIEISAI